MSPKSIPARIRRIPPITSSRRALSGAKECVSSGWPTCSASLPAAMLSRCCPLSTKRWHHFRGEQMLRLDRFPVLKPAEVGDDGQLSDPTFRLQFLNLPNYFLRGTDEGDLLFHDLVVGQLSKGLKSSAGIKTVSLRPQLRLLAFILQRLDGRSIECEKVVQRTLHLFADLLFIVINIDRANVNDVRLMAMLGTGLLVDPERPLQHTPGQQRRDENSPSSLAGHLIGYVAGAARVERWMRLLERAGTTLT